MATFYEAFASMLVVITLGLGLVEAVMARSTHAVLPKSRRRLTQEVNQPPAYNLYSEILSRRQQASG
jgi:hypothetical protein